MECAFVVAQVLVFLFFFQILLVIRHSLLVGDVASCLEYRLGNVVFDGVVACVTAFREDSSRPVALGGCYCGWCLDGLLSFSFWL